MSLKGNAVVGQSGGCTAVINCSLLGVIEAVKKEKDVETLYGMRHGVEGLLKDNLVDLNQYDDKTIQGLYNTPSAALGSCRYKMHDEDLVRAIETLKKYNIHYFYLIGGNDSADTSHRISEKAKELNYELRAMAIPKTIDNDLPVTDHCPGYGSVARFIAQTTQEAGLDTRSMKGVDPFKIIEVMGRNAGWMVAASALGKTNDEDAPHLMYSPELPFDKAKFLKEVEEVYKKVGYCVIVISETIRDRDGKKVGEKTSGVKGDSFGHGYVEGTAHALCRFLEDHFGKRARFDKPGTIQRMSIPYISEVDQEEAKKLGEHAVKLSVEGVTGEMTIIERLSDSPYQVSYGSVSIDKIANTEKLLPVDFINEAGNFVTQAYLDYAKPLIGKPLPKFARL